MPRNSRVAARMLGFLAAVAAVVFALNALFAGGTVAYSLDIITPVALGVLAVPLLRPPTPWTDALCLAVVLVGIFLITAITLATHENGAAGQAFFCLPALWAASQLRIRGAVLVTAAALAGDAVLAFGLQPWQAGVKDFAYVGAAIVLTTMVLLREVRIQDQLVAELRRQAAHDPLTGLYTRHVLDEAARTAMTSAGDSAGTVLIVLDVDRFKTINDTYGHPVGDLALAHIADILSARSRPRDVVARLGGDEIAILLPGCSYQAGMNRAEDFVQRVRATPLVLADDVSVPLSISAGVAHAPEDAAELRDLYASADAALYRAKHGGRDQVGAGQVPAPVSAR